MVGSPVSQDGRRRELRDEFQIIDGSQLRGSIGRLPLIRTCPRQPAADVGFLSVRLAVEAFQRSRLLQLLQSGQIARLCLPCAEQSSLGTAIGRLMTAEARIDQARTLFHLSTSLDADPWRVPP